MRRNRAFLAAMLVLAFGAACHADEQGKTVLARGLFSYQAPPGWDVRDLPHTSFPAAAEGAPGEPGGTITAAIENFPGSLSEYVAGHLDMMRRIPGHEGMEVMKSGSFLTAAGLGCTRVVTSEAIAGQAPTQQILYFFDGGSGEKIIVTATCPTAYVARYEPLFDASLKTFTLE